MQCITEFFFLREIQKSTLFLNGYCCNCSKNVKQINMEKHSMICLFTVICFEAIVEVVVILFSGIHGEG